MSLCFADRFGDAFLRIALHVDEAWAVDELLLVAGGIAVRLVAGGVAGRVAGRIAEAGVAGAAAEGRAPRAVLVAHLGVVVARGVAPGMTPGMAPGTRTASEAASRAAADAHAHRLHSHHHLLTQQHLTSCSKH